MTNPTLNQSQTSASPTAPTASQKISDAASEAAAQVSEIAREAGNRAKQAAVDTASTASDQVKEMLDRQIGSGASIAGQFAKSARLAADDLEKESPLLAGLVASFANKIEAYAGDFQHQSVDELTRSAADFTRRQPALVFGLTALAGFLIFRAVKNTAPIDAPPIQPYGDSAGMERSHGA